MLCMIRIYSQTPLLATSVSGGDSLSFHSLYEKGMIEGKFRHIMNT